MELVAGSTIDRAELFGAALDAGQGNRSRTRPCGHGTQPAGKGGALASTGPWPAEAYAGDLTTKQRTALRPRVHCLWRESDQKNLGRGSADWSLGMRPPIHPNTNTTECWLLQCSTIPTARRISGSGISSPLRPIHGVLRASVVSLQLGERLGAGPAVKRP